MKIADILLICIAFVSISACAQSDEGTPATEHAIEIVSDIDGATMVLIPAGTFQMGSTTGDSDEQPVHTVILNAFYMDQYEVTNARYQKFVESTGYPQPPLSHNPRFNAPDAPVVRVNWRDAAAYAAWANKRLPTEAEWEYAARGNLTGKLYPNGDIMTHTDANFGSTGATDQWKWTAPVGSFQPNGYNLYDMAGNAWEWCLQRTNTTANSIASVRKITHVSAEKLHQITKTFVSCGAVDGAAALKTSASQIGGITSHLAVPLAFVV